MLLGMRTTQLRVLTSKLCAIELVAWGVLYYTFAVFMPAMEGELGWSPATLAGGFSLALLVAGVAAPFVGFWIDRRGSRGLMVTGALVGGAGIVAWSLAHSLPVYFAAWALIGAGMAGTLYAPAFATVVRAHPGESRNAILIITLVGALASTIFMPLASVLGEGVGWRIGLLVLAGAMVVVVSALALSLPNSEPRSERCQDPGASESGAKAPGGFRLLAGSLMVADAASVAVNVHLVLFLVERGHGLQLAASIAGMAGAAKLGGRLATAAGARVSALTLMRLSLPLTAAALLLPLRWPATWAAVAMVIVFGATTGARTILRPAIVVEMFGSRDFGKSNGFLQFLTTTAKAGGPVGFGLLLGAVGWGWAWPVLAALLLASGAALLALRPERSASAAVLRLNEAGATS